MQSCRDIILPFDDGDAGWVASGNSDSGEEAIRLAVLLAKDNSALLFNRLPIFPPTEIDGTE